MTNPRTADLAGSSRDRLGEKDPCSSQVAINHHHIDGGLSRV